MSDSQNYHHLGPPTLNEQSNNHNNLSMLYCGFFVVVTVGLILAVYHCIAFSWCTVCPFSWLRNGEAAAGTPDDHHQKVNANKKLMQLDSTLFKYKRGGNNGMISSEECAVCLSVFEEGDDVRKLVRCEHSFHAPCIDMWLYSHFDCPLCRAPVGDRDGGFAQTAQNNSDVLPV